MNRILAITLTIVLSTTSLIGQEVFPSFLYGKWKVENEEIYEHWDMLNEHNLKGFVYTLESGHPLVIEYLDITWQSDTVTYTATVIGHNNGRDINFIMSQADSITYSFKNSNHDFPKIITYKKQSASKVMVTISDGNIKTISYFIIKQE